jgi:UDP-N-acetylglucosamine 3-dehydrogenase
MGRNHARLYHELQDIELVGLAEVDAARAQRLAHLYGTRAYVDYRQLLEHERPEAVSVAVPTQAHHAVVTDALAAGAHVLVEKPIAATLAEADQLVAMANDRQRVLMVGHVERFNPAVIELKRRLDLGQLGRIFQIHARRLGPFPPRVRDVGVVVDLATHDLDVMRWLSGSEALRLYAEVKREVHTSREDLLSAIVRFQNDTLGVLEINWLTPTKVRELCLTGERGMFRVDYLTQDLYFYENAEAGGATWNPLSVLRGVSEGAMIRFAVQRVEPLRAELEAFIAAVSGCPDHVVSGRDGRAALRLALQLIEAAETHHSLDVIAYEPAELVP